MPSDKRARQRAGRQARLAEIQRAQQRSRRNRRLIPAVVVIVALAALGVILTSRGGGSSKATTTTASKPAAGTAAVPVGGTASQARALVVRTPPARSSACSAHPAASAPTTTTPASGNAVSMVDAPAGTGFPQLDGSSPRYTHFTSAPPFCIDVAKRYVLTMTTDVGPIQITLDPQVAPVTVNNIVFLAGYHYFDGTVFHRVIPGFVDQGGDPTGTGSGGPGYRFADELPRSAAAYADGALAMANSGPNTNGSQFFLVVNGGGAQLSPNYTYFGQITSGLAVADKINADGDSADNGQPPKVTHKLLTVTVTAA